VMTCSMDRLVPTMMGSRLVSNDTAWRTGERMERRDESSYRKNGLKSMLHPCTRRLRAGIGTTTYGLPSTADEATLATPANGGMRSRA
jgi:hypothetical protein